MATYYSLVIKWGVKLIWEIVIKVIFAYAWAGAFVWNLKKKRYVGAVIFFVPAVVASCWLAIYLQ